MWEQRMSGRGAESFEAGVKTRMSPTGEVPVTAPRVPRRRTGACLLFFLFLTLALGGFAVGARENFPAVDVVPVAKSVTLDGDLKEWDPAAFVETFYDLSLYPNFSMRLAFQYDAKALYIGAHLVDATPLVNAIDPAVNPKEGWKGDCLQVRLISDPAAPFPYPAGKDTSERICHLTLWYDTARQQPVLNHEYGMDYHGMKTLTGKDAGVVFRMDPDNKGYTLEARIPWDRLNAAPKPPQAGDTITLTVQPLWGNDTGTANTINFYEVTSRPGFAYQSAASWGRAQFASKGKVTPRPNPALAAGEDAAARPLRLKLKLDDPQAQTVSLGLFAADKGLVRTLPVTVRRDAQRGADFELAWDGLDDDAKPLLVGDYELKSLTHRGIGQTFVASLGNSGNPPWKTDDGTGGWGGDWAPPVAAAADAQNVYLGWGVNEAGPALVCVKKELDAKGMYRKLWGAHPAMHNDVGMVITALATDGERLFVAQDGKTYGGFKDKNAKAFPAVTLYDAHNGRPLTFPSGKPKLSLQDWDVQKSAVETGKPLFERRKTGDFGPQQQALNLTGIAVRGDQLYAALFMENKVVAVNWKTGEKSAEFAAPAPSGVVVDASGRLVVAASTGLLRIDPVTGASETLAAGQLARPWGVSIDGAGNAFVADCGTSMQVKVFTPDGKLQRTIGKPGGRAWVGTYDATGLLMPAGIAADADGKVWVMEYDELPRRVSVWDAAGKNVGDFHGPCVPQTDRGVDPANPRRINCQMVEYDLDYATGQYKCVTTLWRPHVDGWTPVSCFGRASRLLMRTVQGRQYAFLDHGYADNLGAIFIRKGDRLQPCASLGMGPCVPVMKWGNEECAHGMISNPEQWLGPEKWKAVWDAGRKEFCHPNQFWHTWVDQNDDGIVQPEELQIERRDWSDKQVWSARGVDADLTLWGQGGYDTIFRIPVKEFTAQGIPIYPGRKEALPMFRKLSAADASIWMDAKHQRVYGFDAKGGDSRMRGEWAAVSCYDFSGKLQWLYRPTWLSFALDSPFWKPGLVIGVNKFIGQVDLTDKLTVLVTPGYYGNYHMISGDGLYVHAFCQDNRLGGGATADTVFIENMTGIFYRNDQNGKVYLIGGDIDARVWEVTGLETIRTAAQPLTITAADVQAATIAAGRTAKATAPSAIALAPVSKGIAIDGKTAEWKFDRAVSLDAGPGRGAKIALAYDEQNLYAAFRVDDRSPLVNGATDAALLFKGGDLCDVMLAADPQADPKRAKPVAGDTRLSFSVLDGKPVCVLYQAVSGTGTKSPKTFSSPTGNETFERVQILEAAKVAVQRSDTGYELEAAVPWSELGFKPTTDLKTRGDVGVLFGTDGGGRTILRAYYANKDTAIVEDVPSEARLTPAKWTAVEVGKCVE